MGFLEDIGRSRALSGVNTVMNMAVNLKGLDLQEQRLTQQNAIDLERLGILRAQEARAAESEGVALSKAKNELSIQNAEIKRRGKPIADIRMHPLMQRFPEETQKAAFEMGVGLGYFDAETGATNPGGVEDFLAYLNKDPAGFDKVLRGPIVRQYEAKYAEALNTAKELEAKKGPQDPKVKEAWAAVQQVYMEMEKQRGTLDTAAKEVQKNKAASDLQAQKDAAALEQARVKPLPFWASPTGQEDRGRKAFDAQYDRKFKGIAGKYKLSASEVQRIMAGDDASFVTDKMEKSQAEKFIAEISELNEQYDVGINDGSFKWRPSKPKTSDSSDPLGLR